MVFALGFIASRQNNEGSVSDLRESATQTQASEVEVPELPSAVPVAPAPQATEPAAAPVAP